MLPARYSFITPYAGPRGCLTSLVHAVQQHSTHRGSKSTCTSRSNISRLSATGRPLSHAPRSSSSWHRTRPPGSGAGASRMWGNAAVESKAG
jgi:hypothetical protein